MRKGNKKSDKAKAPGKTHRQPNFVRVVIFTPNSLAEAFKIIGYFPKPHDPNV